MSVSPAPLTMPASSQFIPIQDIHGIVIVTAGAEKFAEFLLVSTCWVERKRPAVAIQRGRK
jgi:hypothetical protein